MMVLAPKHLQRKVDEVKNVMVDNIEQARPLLPPRTHV